MKNMRLMDIILVNKLLQKLKTIGFIRTIDLIIGRLLTVIVPQRLRFLLWDFDRWWRFHNAYLWCVQDSNKDLVVLDVGGGGGDFATYASYFQLHTIVCEPNLHATKKSVQNGNLTVCASGTALPFPDKSFQKVIALHVLEHIPQNLRHQFVKELWRVTSQSLLLICPEGKWSLSLSQRIIGFWQRLGLEILKMELEHLEYGVPKLSEITTYFYSADCKFEHLRTRNYYLEIIYFAMIQIPIVRFLVSPLLVVPMILLSRVPPMVEATVIAKQDSLR